MLYEQSGGLCTGRIALALDSTLLNGERGNLAKENKFSIMGCQRDLPLSADCTENLGNYGKQVSSSCSDICCLHALFLVYHLK